MKKNVLLNKNIHKQKPLNNESQENSPVIKKKSVNYCANLKRSSLAQSQVPLVSSKKENLNIIKKPVILLTTPKIFSVVVPLIKDKNKNLDTKSLENKEVFNSSDNKYKTHRRNNTSTSIIGVNMNENKISNENYLYTEPLPHNNLQLSLSQSNNKIVGNESKENGVIACLTNSLKILERIQKDFETSAKNNILNIEENNTTESDNLIHIYSNSLSYNTTDYLTPTKSNANLITNDLANLGLTLSKVNLRESSYNSSSKLKYAYYQAVNISEEEKKFINRQLIENSDNRIRNYTNLFSIINTTLEDIKANLMELQQINQTYQYSDREINKEKNLKRFSAEPFDVRILKFDYGFDDHNNIDEHVEYLKENLLGIKSHSFLNEESCDLSETSMLENRIIVPPKLENRCSLLKYQDSVKYNSNNTEKKEDNLDLDLDDDDSNNSIGTEDKTIIEYESILNEEIDFKKISNNCTKYEKVLNINERDVVTIDNKKLQMYSANIPQLLPKKTFTQNSSQYNSNENTDFTHKAIVSQKLDTQIQKEVMSKKGAV